MGRGGDSNVVGGWGGHCYIGAGSLSKWLALNAESGPCTNYAG